MQTVFIAGATGYLGQRLVAAFKQKGWRVVALTRSAESAKAVPVPPDDWVVAEATRTGALRGALSGVDVVVSALGVTRQKDRLSPWNVDYQANKNLLDEAISAGVAHFAYVHVLNARAMLDVPLVAAKQAFADRLASAPIGHTVVAPSGYFSDMADFLRMAERGRVWLFGDGQNRLNPIHGDDLAEAVEIAVSQRQDHLQIGGPEALTHRQIAELAFAALGAKPRITCLPDGLRRIALSVLKLVRPKRLTGPAVFFLTAIGLDMVGQATGLRRLADFFAECQRKRPHPT